MKKVECFKIRLLDGSEGDVFNTANHKPILDINCLSNILQCNPTIIEADPFLFVFKDKLFLFYESKKLRGPGVIKMIWTNDLTNWSKPKIVLEEPFHLSFPFVFLDGGHVYMLPESGESRSIRLYEAVNDNLDSFKYVNDLLTIPDSVDVKMAYADSIIYKKSENYYLFTSLQYLDGINTLELYTSSSLIGEYKLHPSSPINKSQRLGRNAGSILCINNKLYRLSQDCTVNYGDNVDVNEVIDLSPSSYDEFIQKDFVYPKSDFYKNGGHHYNMTFFKGRCIISTDAKEYHFLFIHRIISKIIQLFMR